MLPEKFRGSILSPPCPSVRLSVCPGIPMGTCWVPKYLTNVHLWELSIHSVRLLLGSHSITLQQNHVLPITLLFEVRFETISQKLSPYWDDVSRATFGLLPWRSRSQHDLSVNSCLAHKFVIWSQSLLLFHIIDHHIDTTCCALHKGRYLEGQGHSMTFQQNCFRPVTLLFEVDLKTISHEWSPYWDDVSSASFRLLPWRSRSQQDLTAKTCPAHNLVIWSRIL